MYDNGKGVERDYEQARFWFQKTAEQGHASAQTYLAVMHEYGHGVTKNYKKAIEWYKKAAEQGHVTAQNNLAVMYNSGKGTQQDFALAEELYLKAATQDLSQAQYNLGSLYYREREYEKAKTWLQKSAQKENAEALRNLGLLYLFGSGIEEDNEKAASLFEKAFALENDGEQRDFTITVGYCGNSISKAQ